MFLSSKDFSWEIVGVNTHYYLLQRLSVSENWIFVKQPSSEASVVNLRRVPPSGSGLQLTNLG